nr:hypothetical protein [Rhizobium sp. T1473]
MIVEDQLDGGAGRIGGIEQPEEFDELAAAVVVLDERVDLACQQVNSSQQAERAMPSILKIARKGRMDACTSGKSGAVVEVLPPALILRTAQDKALCEPASDQRGVSARKGHAVFMHGNGGAHRLR